MKWDYNAKSLANVKISYWMNLGTLRKNAQNKIAKSIKIETEYQADEL